MAATYLLDTNIISALIRTDARLRAWLAGLTEDDRILTSTIVRGEILFGLARLPAGKRRTDLEVRAHAILAVIPCEPLSAAVADAYAQIKVTRLQTGFALDENDLWIAASAMALGAVLVSRDNDFTLLNGLTVLAVT